MTNTQWIIYGVILGLSFIGFIIVILIGYASSKSLDKGEMRRAITAFLILLFGLLVVSSFFPTGITLPDEIKGLFAGTVTTLIGFYFGARTSETLSGKDKSNSQNQPGGSNPDPNKQ